MEQVARFAEVELGALALMGGTGQNTGLPRTDNQKARDQVKDGDKKRAAAALAKQQPQPAATAAATKAAAEAAAAAAKAAAVWVDGAHYCSTAASWAKDCAEWTTKGVCERGVSCHFAHPGFPTSELRCVTCGHKSHLTAECKCPGGQKDPKYTETWAEYRQRKAAAKVAGKGSYKKAEAAKAKGAGTGKGKGAKDNTKGDAGKGKDKGKGKGKGKDVAKAAVDARVASVRKKGTFP